MANAPGVTCRVLQSRFDIHLDWSEVRGQELPNAVSQRVEVHQRSVLWPLGLGIPPKMLVSTRLRLAEHTKDLP